MGPIDVGSDRQLFIDELFFDRQENVKLTMHRPEIREPVLASDMPWERQALGYVTVLQDGDVFKMWYRADTNEDSSDRNRWETDPTLFRSETCYAESTDGVQWEKPNLGVVDFEGSRDNNIVEVATPHESVINMSVVLDPNAPADERYKMVGRNDTGPVDTLGGFLSADGFRWREAENPLITRGGEFKAQNNLIWDDEREVYLALLPLHAGDYGGIHAFRWSESNDFKTWTLPERSLTPDDDDPPLMRLYTPSAVKYRNAARAFVMLVPIMYPDRRYDPDQNMGLGDVQLATSRDGKTWERRFRGAWLRPGLDDRNWVDRNPMSAQGILQTSPEELSMYYTELGRSGSPHNRVRRCTLRTDGFISVEGPYAGWGEFTTPPMIFSGSELEVNYSTSGGGSILVELQDADGAAVPGFSLDDCDVIFGDKIAGVVRWKGGGDMSSVSGRPVRMRVRMRDADLYAFKFNK